MKASTFILSNILAMTLSFVSSAAGPQPSYVISGGEISTEGEVLVKIAVDDRSQAGADHLKKAAVDGVLFKGYESEGRLPGLQAIVPADKAGAAADFFRTFFDTGEYLLFADIIPGTVTCTKIKKGYRTRATVQIHRDRLRKHLEDKGIIDRLWKEDDTNP